MEKFIELTEATEKFAIKINVRHIVSYNQYDDNQSRMSLAFREHALYVKETYGEITELIERSEPVNFDVRIEN
jgi:ribosome biogenesis protein Nip4